MLAPIFAPVNTGSLTEHVHLDERTNIQAHTSLLRGIGVLNRIWRFRCLAQIGEHVALSFL
jgi:hypothetical protein